MSCASPAHQPRSTVPRLIPGCPRYHPAAPLSKGYGLLGAKRLACPQTTCLPPNDLPAAKSHEADRIDVHVDEELALRLGPGRKPVPDIVLQAGVAWRLEDEAHPMAPAQHGDRRFGGAENADLRIIGSHARELAGEGLRL